MSKKACQFIPKIFKSILMICPVIIAIAVIPNSVSAQEMHAENLMPVYTGGIDAIKETVAKNLHYPEAALKSGISGTVLVNFTVDPEGKVQNVRIMQGLSPECDAEALRVTSLLKGWSPGVRQGKPVNITVSMPVEWSPVADR